MRRSSKLVGRIIFVGVLLIFFYDSWTYKMIVDVNTDTQAYHDYQTYLWQSLEWMEDNLDPNEGVLAVTEWRFRYLPALAGFRVEADLFLTPRRAVEVMREYRLKYVAVTNTVTADIDAPPIAVELPRLYRKCADFTLIYENPQVSIYKLKS
jgi:hypothetical protein